MPRVAGSSQSPPTSAPPHALAPPVLLSPPPQDIKTGRELLEEDFVKANPKWHKELEMMVQSKVKAEIQALSSFGFQYLSQVFLPQKLKEADWI